MLKQLGGFLFLSTLSFTMQAAASITAGFSAASLSALTGIVEQTGRGQDLLVRAHRGSAYQSAPPGSKLYKRIVDTTGGSTSSALVRPYTTDHDILGLYLDDHSGLPEHQNRGHVDRLLTLAERAAISTGLSHVEFSRLRRAEVYSDVAKNMPWVNATGGFQGLLAPLARFQSPEGVQASLEPNLILDGVADWLKWYQHLTGGALQLRPLSDTHPNTSVTADRQRTWGFEPFKMHTQVGQGLSDRDRYQALRLLRIIFHGSTPFHPTGLLFHEIPGYALAYANREPLDVLLGIFGHNGPIQTMRAGELGQRWTYQPGDSPYWASLTNSLLFGGYPFVVENHLQGILHNISDRWEQGGLFEVDGKLVGGLRKILGDRLMYFEESPLASVIETLEKVPLDSAGQIHAIWHYRVTSLRLRHKLFPFYRAAIEALEGNRDLIKYINLNQSTDYKIVFRDGHSLEIPRDVIPDSEHRLTETATARFLEDFFDHLKILKDEESEAIKFV